MADWWWCFLDMSRQLIRFKQAGCYSIILWLLFPCIIEDCLGLLTWGFLSYPDSSAGLREPYSSVSSQEQTLSLNGLYNWNFFSLDKNCKLGDSSTSLELSCIIFEFTFFPERLGLVMY